MRYKTFVIIAILLLPSFCLAAQQKTPPENSPSWSYDDDYTGQEDWGNIKGYELCNDGKAQSPITISYTKAVPLPPFSAEYKTASAKLETTNKSFTIKLKNAGKISVDGISYSLQKIEFHSPSEHVIRDKYYPLEIHLVHKSDTGKILIIALFADKGFEKPALAYLSKIPASGIFELNSAELLPKSLAYYSYTGSLPYPPCTEGVKWLIMKSPIAISSAQLSSITKFIGRNNRLPQPVYLREILETM